MEYTHKSRSYDVEWNALHYYISEDYLPQEMIQDIYIYTQFNIYVIIVVLIIACPDIQNMFQ